MLLIVDHQYCFKILQGFNSYYHHIPQFPPKNKKYLKIEENVQILG